MLLLLPLLLLPLLLPLLLLPLPTGDLPELPVLLPLGLLPSRTSRGRAEAVSLPLLLPLELLKLWPVLLMLLPLGRTPGGLLLRPAHSVPMLATLPACGVAAGIPTPWRMGPGARRVPADVVPPDRLAEPPLVVVSWTLHLGSSLNLRLTRPTPTQSTPSIYERISRSRCSYVSSR